MIKSSPLSLARSFIKLNTSRNSLYCAPLPRLAQPDNDEIQIHASKLYRNITTKAFLELFNMYRERRVEFSKIAANRDASVLNPGDVIIPNHHKTFRHYFLSSIDGYDLPEKGNRPFIEFYIYISPVPEGKIAAACLRPEYDVLAQKGHATFFNFAGKSHDSLARNMACDLRTIWKRDTEFVRFLPSERIARIINEVQKLRRMIEGLLEENS